MQYLLRKTIFSVLTVFAFYTTALSQLPYKLIDGRQHRYCESCNQVIQNMPPEVLFGIQINTNGDIFFSINNKKWFDYIFKNDSYGVSIDLVAKDRYACDKDITENFLLPKGTMLTPIYRKDLLIGMDDLIEGSVFTKIGKVPAALMKKQLEGNLVIINGNYICFYTNFVDIERSGWELLPMGLFTDSLTQNTEIAGSRISKNFTYSKKIQVEAPFEKGSTSFSNTYMAELYDSLELKKYTIKKIEIRAYSSVEGSEKLNKELMSKRAKAMIAALKKYQPSMRRTKVITAENWIDFFKDIEPTKYKELKTLSKVEIKQRLTDKIISVELEPLLARQRKVIATLYLESASSEELIKDSSILSTFKKAIIAKDILKARAIQKELAERIMDNKLPVTYINKLEVPQSKDFSSLLNDREVYKFLLKATSEYEALENLLSIQKNDPDNGRINYNICTLRFFLWQYSGDTTAVKVLLPQINALTKQGINSTLIKRMLINYYILKSEDQLRNYDYAGKNESISIIHDIYEGLTLNDEDIYSIAKYYSYYSLRSWAEEIVTPRIDKIDVSEDLVFYYVNLLFFHPGSYNSDHFTKAILNAINLNNKRFCDFFLPNDKGGASMQLLDYNEIKKLYCQECR